MIGVDILCQAKSGMGKTAVFVLTILHQLPENPKPCSAIVLCHNRELAYQIKKEFARFRLSCQTSGPRSSTEECPSKSTLPC